MKLRLKVYWYSSRNLYKWFMVNSNDNIVAESLTIYVTPKKALAAGRKFIKDIKMAEIVKDK